MSSRTKLQGKTLEKEKHGFRLFHFPIENGTEALRVRPAGP